MPIKVFWSEACNTYGQVSVEPPLAMHLASANIITAYGDTCIITYDYYRNRNLFYGNEGLGKDALNKHREFIQRAFLPYAKFLVHRAQDDVDKAREKLAEAQKGVDILLPQCLTPDE